MKPDKVNPREVFYQPARMVVPLFQRPYVWSRETQWEPLWQDIVRLIEVIEQHDPQATHFLGAIVTQQIPIGLGGLPTANVIDGQQRLTTLQLLLDALHSELERRGMENLASQVHHLIENPPDACENEEDRYKLWPTNRDRDAFAATMSAQIPPTMHPCPLRGYVTLTSSSLRRSPSGWVTTRMRRGERACWFRPSRIASRSPASHST